MREGPQGDSRAQKNISLVEKKEKILEQLETYRQKIKKKTQSNTVKAETKERL